VTLGPRESLRKRGPASTVRHLRCVRGPAPEAGRAAAAGCGRLVGSWGPPGVAQALGVSAVMSPAADYRFGRGATVLDRPTRGSSALPARSRRQAKAQTSALFGWPTCWLTVASIGGGRASLSVRCRG
jgi:hypothetical protein